jgi:tight adherence protein C
MRPADLILIGVPLFAGAALLARSLDGAARYGLLRRAQTGFVNAHRSANTVLVRKGILRVPGIHLVNSLRAWLAGEAVVLFAAALAVSLAPAPAHAVSLLLIAFVLGAATVFLALRDEAGKRLDDFRRTLPSAAFLMSLLLDAGMGSRAALQEVVASLPPGPLPRELEEISRSRDLGIPRAEALERSRARIPLNDYRLFLNLVQQGERLGTGLSQGLRELSSRMMESREHRAEALAQKAAVKLLFPLVVFIFPAVFLVILSPVILALLDMMGQ